MRGLRIFEVSRRYSGAADQNFTVLCQPQLDIGKRSAQTPRFGIADAAQSHAAAFSEAIRTNEGHAYDIEESQNTRWHRRPAVGDIFHPAA